jgi:hypothetical protein
MLRARKEFGQMTDRMDGRLLLRQDEQPSEEGDDESVIERHTGLPAEPLMLTETCNSRASANPQLS